MKSTISSTPTVFDAIEKALASGHYETARRMCRRALAGCAYDERGPLLRLLHETLRKQGDFVAALALLREFQPRTLEEETEFLLLLAEDYTLLSNDSFYRDSEEKRAGYSVDEYVAKMRSCALEPLDAATANGLNGQAPRAAALYAKLGQKQKALALQSNQERSQHPPQKPVLLANDTGSVSGFLTFPDGAPVADAIVTLGLDFEIESEAPEDYLGSQMHFPMKLGRQQARTTRTDDRGWYRLESIPVGHHAFLAVTLDGQKYEINTRFFVQEINVTGEEEAVHDAVIGDWQSAAPHQVENPFPEDLVWQGDKLRRLHTETWHNPFYYEFPRQLVEWPLPEGVIDGGHLLLLSCHQPDTPIPVQVVEESLVFFADLPPQSERALALYHCETPLQSSFASQLNIREEESVITIETGRAAFRFPLAQGQDAQPPLLEVRGEDGVWRGQGRWILPDEVSIVSCTTNLLAAGPLLCTVEVCYQLTQGHAWSFAFTLHEGEAYLLCHETAPQLEGAAFEFSLREFAQTHEGGRGYLHWTPENGSRHWCTLTAENRELARLQESVPWWIPPCGFAYAITPDSLDQQDYIGVFTIRRGEWKDVAFEKLSNGPIDADGTHNSELDWPFPEMVGSTVSMITANTDTTGDAFFRWGAFEGERHWGVLVSTLERNHGPFKEISSVQHKNSSPRLQDFVGWRLDEADTKIRPHVVTERKNLPELRRKRHNPTFAPLWQSLQKGIEADKNGVSTLSMVFAVEGDPLQAWRKKCELVRVAHVRSKMTLLGRDFADMYSPVGARPITGWADDYDLVAASGVFTPDEERLVRSFLMLMGHLYMACDLMNWRYGSRNANFEADRTDVVGAIGLCFHGSHDAATFLNHTVELMERSLDVYCTPGSGKWYENPACYYLQASKCRGNLAFHLWRHGIYDASKLPRFKEFLKWGILLLTPPRPANYELMCEGCSKQEYEATKKRRVIPPLGDHAELGRFVPEHYAFLSQLYRMHDVEFADELMWAYLSGNEPGTHFGNVPVLFAVLQEEDLKPRNAPPLASRRLEGFGAVLRDKFQTPEELYVLWKQGPGGYRYQRSEGSFMLFANSKPLVYEGGEAGETWRHSTLSFHDVHTPLAPGRVERFHAWPGFDFVQGVHAKVLEPGEPIYLSDDCNHQLVQEAYRRFAEPHPADVRSLWRIGSDYLVVHDDLLVEPNLRCHWNLHAVADSETFDSQTGYCFHGRFGTDLQVLLPGQTFEKRELTTLPTMEYELPASSCFATRHLQLTQTSPSGWLAVLRPLHGAQAPLTAQAITTDGRITGIHVEGEEIDDVLWFSRERLLQSGRGLHFEGRYGGVARRPSGLQLALLDGNLLQAENFVIESFGPAVFLSSEEGKLTMCAEGTGKIRVAMGAKEFTGSLAGEKIERVW